MEDQYFLIVMNAVGFIVLIILHLITSGNLANKIECFRTENTNMLTDLQLTVNQLKDKLDVIESKLGHNHKAEMAKLEPLASEYIFKPGIDLSEFNKGLDEMQIKIQAISKLAEDALKAGIHEIESHADDFPTRDPETGKYTKRKK